VSLPRPHRALHSFPTRRSSDLVDSYLWLFPRCDKQLLGQIEHPELPARYFQLHHTAIEKAKVYGTAIVTDLEEVYSPDMVAEVRSEEHTSELQSRSDLVCRLLL